MMGMIGIMAINGVSVIQFMIQACQIDAARQLQLIFIFCISTFAHNNMIGWPSI